MSTGRLQKIRRVWATLGGVALVGFLGWVAVGYRASGEARAALIGDHLVVVEADGAGWHFVPAPGRERRRVGLVFFPGALVDPRAYAPLARRVATAGYPAVLVALPWRGAFGTADRPAVRGRARRAMEGELGVDAWVVAGHSRGAKVAALLARDGAPELAGLVLIGSTHPRDFSLAELEVPVVKIYGTNDGVAPADAVLANRHLLPESTTWIRIEGGNHSQFGWYGFQPLDRFADISREEQQAQTIGAIRELLARVESSPGGTSRVETSPRETPRAESSPALLFSRSATRPSDRVRWRSSRRLQEELQEIPGGTSGDSRRNFRGPRIHPWDNVPMSRSSKGSARSEKSLEERSAQRAARIVANRAHSFEEAERWDLDYWQSRTPQERLSALVHIRRDVRLAQAAKQAERKPSS